MKTVWNNATVAELRRLYVTGEIDHEVVFTTPEAMDEFRLLLAKRLVNEAHTLVIEAHVGDVQFEDTEVEMFTTTVHAHWSPKTHEVEFRGGQEDGTCMMVKHLDCPLRVPIRNLPVYALTEANPMDLTDHILTYQMAGWSETDRRWVYDLDTR